VYFRFSFTINFLNGELNYAENIGIEQEVRDEIPRCVWMEEKNRGRLKAAFDATIYMKSA